MKERISVFSILSKKKIPRRDILKYLAAGFVSLISAGLLFKPLFAKTETSKGRPKKNIRGNFDLVVAKGEDPYEMTAKAVEAMGGMERFVKKNGTVLIKPNIGWDRTPEQAANTNPQVIAALITLSYKAGAKKVSVFDRTCNDARYCYVNSGIQKAAMDAGANVFFPHTWNTVNAKFPYESPMEDWPIFRDAVDCDTFINVPIVKHHGISTLTLSMKNLMGVCGGKRGLIHFNIGQKLVDITDFISPDLTIIDAYRVLFRHGPSGGDLADVKKMKTIAAATDPTLADSFAARLMDVDPMSVPNIRNAAQRNFGKWDITKAKISYIKV